MRVSDSDREQAADVLREAAGHGRITMDELDERLELAYAAKTYGDLAAVTEPGRLAATALGLVGQVYLVVFVAMIVGLRAQEWRAGRGDELLPPPDGVFGHVARDGDDPQDGDPRQR